MAGAGSAFLLILVIFCTGNTGRSARISMENTINDAQRPIAQILPEIGNRSNTSSEFSVTEYSRIEGGVAETDGTKAPYFSRVDVTTNLNLRTPMSVGALISKRHILTTAWVIDPLSYESSSPYFNSITTIHAILGDSQEFEVGLSNVIRHPDYVRWTYGETSLNTRIRNQPAILRLPSDAVLGDYVKTIPIMSNAGSSYIGQSVTILDWNLNLQSVVYELQKANYVGVGCSTFFMSLEWSLCFELADTSLPSSLDKIGKMGSPIVVDYGTEKAALVGVKTYYIIVNPALSTRVTTIASSMSYDGHTAFVCQYADKCIFNDSNASTTTAAPKRRILSSFLLGFLNGLRYFSK